MKPSCFVDQICSANSPQYTEYEFLFASLRPNFAEHSSRTSSQFFIDTVMTKCYKITKYIQRSYEE